MNDPIFPHLIEKYEFIERIMHKTQTEYIYALYKDSKGNKYFAKAYSGRPKSKSRKLLEKEVAILKLLQRYNLSFVLPVVSTSISKWNYIVLFPFVKAKELISYSYPSKIKTLINMLDKISSLSSIVKEDEHDKVLAYRSGWMLVLSYPFVLLKALIVFPGLFLLFFHILVLFIQGAHQLFNAPADTISHRDVHPRNILKRGKTEILVDWCYAAFCVKDWDYIVLLISRWDESKIRKSLLKTRVISAYHRSLAIFIATLFLTDRNLSQRIRQSIVQFLLEIHKIPIETTFISPVSLVERIRIAVWEVILGITQEHISYLPKHILGYTRITQLAQNKYTNISVGLYETKRHEKVIIKIWEGKRKTLSYINLRHEIAVYQVLTNVINRLSQKLVSTRIHVPTFITYKEQANKLILVKSCIEGRQISSIQNPKEQLLSVTTIINYLRELTQHMTQEERLVIGQRTLIHFLFFLPIVIITLLKKNPRELFSYIRAIRILLRGIPSLISEQTYVLTHGDLHGENIFLNGKEIGIIDCEQMRITYPHYDVIAAISSRKTHPTVASTLLRMLLSESYKSKLQLPIASLMVNCSLHNLMSNAHPESKVRYQTLLDIGSRLGRLRSLRMRGVTI